MVEPQNTPGSTGQAPSVPLRSGGEGMAFFDMLAMLSHELRQPLAAAVSALEVQKRSISPERRERAGRVIAQQLQQMMRLVDDLRDATLLARGTFPLRRERVDLRVIVREALEMTRARFEQKRQRTALTDGPAPVWVMADPVRMRQVFSNLLQNASAYTPDQGHIDLELEMDDTQVALHLRDTGAGIAGNALERIFDVFERGPQPGDGASLGIGLAVVRQVVEQHGGAVTVHSEGPGRGSEFVVTLSRCLG